jgi:drug/metabolite transporter (DMT)-like permease
VLRHEFQPGKLVAGLFLALAGVVYAGDAGGLWDTPWFAIFPLVVGGLCLAGAVAFLTRTLRRRRRAHRPAPVKSPAETPH